MPESSGEGVDIPALPERGQHEQSIWVTPQSQKRPPAETCFFCSVQKVLIGRRTAPESAHNPNAKVLHHGDSSAEERAGQVSVLLKAAPSRPSLPCVSRLSEVGNRRVCCGVRFGLWWQEPLIGGAVRDSWLFTYCSSCDSGLRNMPLQVTRWGQASTCHVGGNDLPLMV